MTTAMKDETTDQVTVDVLLDDLRTVVRDAEALLKVTEGQAGERIAEIRARAEETLRGARQRLHDASAGIGAHARAAVHSADTYVHEKPWTAIAIAAGIGFLVGYLGRRR
jgi:ElaB/YqjD/DUF883 family membrane-anchored ribosome-binding protein